MRIVRVLAAGGLAVCLALFASGRFISRAADHGDAPTPRFDVRLDVNDVFAFQSPQNPANVAMILTTGPFSRIIGPNTYHPQADYDIFVTTTGDADYEFAFNFRFGAPGAGNLQELHFVGESRSARLFDILGTTGENIALPGGGFIRANEIDDPFVFDNIAFRDNLRFCSGPGGTGFNFFRGANTMAIILELPRALFGTNNIGVYARTVLGGRQIDRMGRPAINAVFIPAALKDAFNFALPKDDAQFRETVIATAQALGNSPARAVFLADFLLPDVVAIDTSSTAGFPNGRRLEDDVIDIELNLITNGALRTDCVPNDNAPFRTVFPYWNPPNP